MTEAWYYFTKQLAALDPAAEPADPAPAEVWKKLTEYIGSGSDHAGPTSSQENLRYEPTD
jgi:hypothetical protein